MVDRVVDSQGWADCRETHLSAVFMAGDRVLKIKKPVRTAFVDMTSLAARDFACQEEVRLNARLSPDVYLGVVHLGLYDDGAGEPMVIMRRLHDEDRLKDKLAAGSALPQQIEDLARCLAVFHSACDVRREPDGPGGWSSVRRAWLRECQEIAHLGDTVADRPTRDLVRAFGVSYLDGRRALFDSRLNTGHVVEGHGDLRCDHVYLTADGVRILDCVEFDAALRIADVVSDLAFLVMDLERLDAAEYAINLLGHCQELTATTFPPTLLDFYVAYRALVRAKVRAIQASEAGIDDPEIRNLMTLAVTHLRRALPVMVCLGGLPGSGKSTLSEEFARTAGAVHVSSDEIRHGLQSRTDGGSDSWETGAYTTAATDEVYRVVLERAQTALSEGCSVVLDASWRDAAQRDRAHAIADLYRAVPIDVICEIDEGTAFRRLARTRDGYSQAGGQIRESMKAAFESWPNAQVLTTDRGVTDVLPELQQIVTASLGLPSPPIR